MSGSRVVVVTKWGFHGSGVPGLLFYWCLLLKHSCYIASQDGASFAFVVMSKRGDFTHLHVLPSDQRGVEEE